jgi:putative acetyltransferase
VAEQVSVVAEVDSKLVGNSEVIRGQLHDEYHHGKLGISLLRDYRNQGIGLEMMKTLIDGSRKEGLKTIELEVFANNPRAVHVYESAGFKEVGRIPKKIFRTGRFIDIIVMAIEL